MYRRKEILIIDDNAWQLQLFKSVANEVAPDFTFKFFHLAEDSPSQFLRTESAPLFLLCHANLDELDAIELLSEVNKYSAGRKYFIPILFFGEDQSGALVRRAYEANASGFFPTPRTADQARFLLQTAINYWSKCVVFP